MALTEEQLELLGERLVPLYQELEQEVIADIARRVKKTGRYTETAEIMVKSLMEQGYSPAKIQKEVMKLIRADKDYQMAVAENTKAYKDMITSEIKKTVEEAKKQGNEIVSEAGMMSYNNDLSMWEQAGKKLSKSDEFTQLVDAMALHTCDELKNLTKTLGFKGTGFTALENVYQHQLDLGLIKLTSGAYSWQQVVDDCVHNLAQSGLRTIDYESGYSMQLDTAVRNCIRTASGQLAGKVTMLNMEENGETLVEVSCHWGARSDGSCGHGDHAYWQGKVYSIDKGRYKKESCRLGYSIENLEDVTGYPSDPRGLLGYNCRHMMNIFFEGISEPTSWDNEPKPVTVNGKEYDYYHATQKQRQMERNIRSTKREIEAQKAIGGDTTVLNAKLKKQMSDYKKFSADVDIRPKNERLRVRSRNDNLRDFVKTKHSSLKEKSKDIIINIKANPIYKNLTIEDFKKIKHSITKEERSIIYGKGHFSGYINSINARKMNDIMRKSDKLSVEYQKIADTLQSVINKNVSPEDIMVTRYVDDDALEYLVGVKVPVFKLGMDKEEFWKSVENLPSLIKNGTKYTEKGFLSTSGVKEENVMKNKGVRLDIKVPKGTNCYITTNNKESEIIFGKNTTLKIVNSRIENNRTANRKVVLECIIETE